MKPKTESYHDKAVKLCKEIVILRQATDEPLLYYALNHTYVDIAILERQRRVEQLAAWVVAFAVADEMTSF